MFRAKRSIVQSEVYLYTCFDDLLNYFTYIACWLFQRFVKQATQSSDQSFSNFQNKSSMLQRDIKHCCNKNNVVPLIWRQLAKEGVILWMLLPWHSWLQARHVQLRPETISSLLHPYWPLQGAGQLFTQLLIILTNHVSIFHQTRTALTWAIYNRHAKCEDD